MRTLHLNLKGEYFDAIKAGTKLREYRLNTARWRKMVEGREYDRILIKRGYPKAGDAERVIERAWAGFDIETITHPHFGPEPVLVFSIRVDVLLG